MISDEQAIEIARAECERRGVHFTPRIEVIHYWLRRRITIRTNADYIGGCSFIDVHPKSGRVLRFWHFSR